MEEYRSLSHTKWQCKYHVVFIPKYRRRTLFGVVRRELGPVFRRLAEQKESRIEEGHILADRVHMQVERGTAQWSRLILKAKPHRKEHCSNPDRLRSGIALLCAGQFLSGRDLSELLHRSQSVLVCRYLIPMAQQGQLETRYPINEGGRCRAHPRQAYRSASAQAETPQPKRSTCLVKDENLCSVEHGFGDSQTADGGPG